MTNAIGGAIVLWCFMGLFIFFVLLRHGEHRELYTKNYSTFALKWWVASIICGPLAFIIQLSRLIGQLLWNFLGE